MKKLNKILSVGLSLVMCAGMVVPSFAATFGQFQDAINNGISVAGAIEVADSENGRTVTLHEDVEQEDHRGNLYVAGKDKNVTLNLNGNSIKGNGTTTIMVVADGANLTVNGADGNGKMGSITGGNDDYGGGMSIWNGSTVELKDVKVTGNTAEYGGGGGLYVDSSNVTLKNVEVSDNQAGFAGGIGSYNATVNIEGGKIAGNTAQNGGGGLYVEAGNATLKNVEVSGNKAGFAGGIEAYNNATVNIDGGRITSNTASGNGGGIIVEVGSNATIKNAKIDHNVTGGAGGGLNIYQEASVEITNSNVHHNVANGIYGGGGAVVHGNAELKADSSHFDNNEAKNSGGGINARDDATVILFNSTVSGNKAYEYYGGGIFAQNADITVDTSMVEKNSAQYGGGVFGTDNADIKVIEGSKVANNSAGERGDDFYGQSGTKLTLPEAASMDSVLEQDSKSITGWYYDSKDQINDRRWGKFYLEKGTVYDGSVAFALKAAHDQYFDVVYTDGVGGTVFENQNHEVENKNPIPGFDGEIPSRPGFTFAGWLVDGESFDPTTGTVTGTLTLVANWRENSAPVDPTDPTDPTDPGTEIEDPDVPLGEEPDDEVEIEDPRVPLAGPFTRADAIGYLWEQTGSPDAELSDFPDVPEDHYWAVAIGWAQDMGIALPDEEGNFRPDDLVLRSSSEPEGELQQFLNRYAVFAGAAEQGESFIQLTGASDDIIMGEEAQVIFDEFFAKLEAALTRKAA